MTDIQSAADELRIRLYLLRTRLVRWRERLPMWIAWKMPRSVAYWCALRVGAHATQGEYGNTIVSDLTFMDAVGRWGHR